MQVDDPTRVARGIVESETVDRQPPAVGVAVELEHRADADRQAGVVAAHPQDRRPVRSESVERTCDVELVARVDHEQGPRCLAARGRVRQPVAPAPDGCSQFVGEHLDAEFVRGDQRSELSHQVACDAGRTLVTAHHHQATGLFQVDGGDRADQCVPLGDGGEFRPQISSPMARDADRAGR